MARGTYILVVEDDEDTRRILADYLRRRYRDVREAADGAEALALLEREGPPDMVLSDIVMPGVLGTSVAEYMDYVRSLNDVPLAFVTGSPELAPVGYAVFPKPAKLAEIAAFVAANALMTK